MPSVLFAQPIELPSILVRTTGTIFSFADFIGRVAYEKSSAMRLGRLRGFRSRSWCQPRLQPKCSVRGRRGRNPRKKSEEEIYVGEMTRRIAQGLTHDPNAVERQL